MEHRRRLRQHRLSRFVRCLESVCEHVVDDAFFVPAWCAQMESMWRCRNVELEIGFTVVGHDERGYYDWIIKLIFEVRSGVVTVVYGDLVRALSMSIWSSCYIWLRVVDHNVLDCALFGDRHEDGADKWSLRPL